MTENIREKFQGVFIDPINSTELLLELLRESHELIQKGIYSEDGIDGWEGQRLLDKIEKHIKVKRSHRDYDAEGELRNKRHQHIMDSKT